MSKHPKVFIIILNYNGKNTIKQCLNSVFQMDYLNFEVVVVDNDSEDGSFGMAKKFFPKAHLIKNSSNVGFAAGNNIGIRFALEKMAEYVFLLNNDALVKKDTLGKLISEAEKNKKIGLLSPLIFHWQDERIWYSGGKINWLTMKSSHSVRKPAKKVTNTQYVTGCAMLVRKEVFKKIGLFDEEYFLYYEDADFSIRTKKAGYGLGVVADAHVYHFEQSEQDSGSKVYWLVLSGLIFFQKNTPLFLKPWIKIYTLARRMKNKAEVKYKKSKTAVQVQKAYDNYYNQK